jgi:hypothetical protein
MSGEGERMSGIRMDLLRADGSVENVAAFAVDGLPYIDMVFKLKHEYCLWCGDSLRIEFDVPVVSRVIVPGLIDMVTHRYTENWMYSTGELTEQRKVSHFRFTKIGDDAWIELLDGMATGLYMPDSTKAEKIR